MKISEKLIKRLKDELDFEVVSIERIPRGRHQNASGQFCWVANLKNGNKIGSADTMKDCVTAKTISLLEHDRFMRFDEIVAERPIKLCL